MSTSSNDELLKTIREQAEALNGSLTQLRGADPETRSAATKILSDSLGFAGVDWDWDSPQAGDGGHSE